MSIHVESRDGIARIGIARPERRNAIDARMYGQLADALGAAARDTTVRVLVLHGTADVFSAGNDIGDFLQSPGPDGHAETLRFMHALIDQQRPVIAAVNGAAVGIGTTLLLHCDLVYAADDAVFSLPFVKLGLCPEFASSLLLGEPIAAKEAVAMGWVNRLLPPDQVLDYALHQARRLCALPAEAVRETKRLLKAGMRAAVQQALAAEFEAFGRLLQSPEARAALNAFLDRHKP